MDNSLMCCFLTHIVGSYLRITMCDCVSMLYVLMYFAGSAY